MNISFKKDLSSPLVNKIKSEQIEYILAKGLKAETSVLQVMKSRIDKMKSTLKQKRIQR
jgi:hypothetical protein